MVHDHASHSAVERLHSHGGPGRNLFPVVILVFAPVGTDLRPITGRHCRGARQAAALCESMCLGLVHADREGLKLGPVPGNKPVNQWDGLNVLLLAIVAIEVALPHQNRLAIVRDEHREPWDVGHPEGPRHRQPQATGKSDHAPLQVFVLRPVFVDAAVSPGASLHWARSSEELAPHGAKRELALLQDILTLVLAVKVVHDFVPYFRKFL
mmetsp:Transcript_33882/g.96898  ORF Transcript_33882/g.96898 Transcript_33882/m.96898 type:complete len:210 (-) Transcript_33882:1084-1713(-)